MKPEGKEYETPVAIIHVWEEIDGEHYLVRDKISEYIRRLEEENKGLKEILQDNLK